MPPLEPSLRNALENTIVEARTVVEEATRAALERLAVHETTFYPTMSEEQRALRRALRAKARQLGDTLDKTSDDPMPGLVRETAYEKWHQMLFAAFLTENNLLIYPGSDIPVTLAECDELAPDLGLADAWEVAANFASKMLPGIFNQDDPSTKVEFAPEERRAIERLLEAIPKPAFTSDDGLGWVYQFWQTQRKTEVNASGRKVGGADLAPVTQLFTEHYMVQFLLHNTLGAWWTSRHPDKPLPTDKSYLRTLDDGTPAAGKFEKWPERAADITIMDPCCGSGHFLVAAFALMKRFRMIEEGLTESEAGDAVIRNNLHGLELDPRCTQIAAFNLALEAWKSGGYRQLPPMNIACSGISVGSSESEWTTLAGDEPKAANALKRLYHMFKNAPDLGSLIDPTRLTDDDSLFTATFEEVESLLGKALASPSEQDDPVTAVFGEATRGITRAADLLRRQYTTVVTNVPYLARGKQADTLKDHIEQAYPNGKADLATAFVERSRDFVKKGGTYALVTPQNWLFLGSYKKLRKELLQTQSWNVAARLGTGAFETISGEVVNVALCVITNSQPAAEHVMAGIDVSGEQTAEHKAHELAASRVTELIQEDQRNNPDSRITINPQDSGLPLLADYAESYQGICSGDFPRFGRYFWELKEVGKGWILQQSTVEADMEWGGRSNVFLWENGSGQFRDFLNLRLGENHGAWVRGLEAWDKQGVCINQTRSLNASLYSGDAFDNNAAVIVPKDSANLSAIWAFCSSPEYYTAVREVDQKLNVTNLTLLKVPFDLRFWAQKALENYPAGLPEPRSPDPTQWLFTGTITESTHPLQVGVARLLRYSWPDQGKSTEPHPFSESEQNLDDLIDEDGIVCLPPVAGIQSAAERLRALLARACSTTWSPTKEAELLASVGYDGKTIDDWLWGDFFKQHTRLFKNRPFIWHVTDGRKDGFSALLNYHTLDRAKLERLIYTYLGSYIQQVQDQVNADVQGAGTRLAAAQELKKKLELILQGEPPYDIYVRWKALHEQPIGWEPDLNDGVRLNTRPWVEAGILRNRFTINWNKDRGNDPTPNTSGTTERHNDLHFTRAEKEEARKAHAKVTA